MLRVIIIFITIVSLQLTTALGQPGSWRDYLSYYSATGLAVTNEMAIVSSGGALFTYEFLTRKVEKLSKVQGLTESGIRKIAWSQPSSTVIIGYQSSNIDLLYKGGVYNMPDISRANISGRKDINIIRAEGSFAYVACSFGIVVIDLVKREIKDTWRPTPFDTEIYDIAFSSSTIYAATGNGIWTAPINSQGLSFSGTWTKLLALPYPDGEYRHILSVGSSILAHYKPPASTGDYFYRITPTVEVLYTEAGLTFNSVDFSENKIVLTGKKKIIIMDPDGIVTRTITAYGQNEPDARQALIRGSETLVADGLLGLFIVAQDGTSERFGPEGPWYSNAFQIATAGNTTFISGGSVNNAWNNTWSPFQLFRKYGNNWASTIRYDIHDAMKIAIDPEDYEHYFVSTWGGGLVEFNKDEVTRIYDENNSPLQSIIPGNNYERIYGLAFDKDKNLWITHTGMPGSIKVLRPDKSWITIPITIDAPTIGEIIITRNGFKWIVLPRGHGIFVYDDNKTPEVFSDDRYKKIVVTDSENKLLNTVYSMAEDQDGSLWIGTDQGPAIFFNPSRVFDTDPKAYRVKVPRNDGSGLADYLLGNEIITSIAVDGGNRKWLGTNSSGLFHVSTDGLKTLNYFNENNSPLLSNSISSVAVNGSNGEVWIATSNGVISYSGDATDGSFGYAGMYAFPNPVRPDFNGVITIAGLVSGTTVKITDVAGNLIKESVSNGGSSTWDLNNSRGNRVSSGVYLIFCSSADGQQAAVTKVLIISRK